MTSSPDPSKSKPNRSTLSHRPRISMHAPQFQLVPPQVNRHLRLPSHPMSSRQRMPLVSYPLLKPLLFLPPRKLTSCRLFLPSRKCHLFLPSRKLTSCRLFLPSRKLMSFRLFLPSRKLTSCRPFLPSRKPTSCRPFLLSRKPTSCRPFLP